MVDGEEGELQSVGDTEFVENIGEVVFDGLLAEGEFQRDVLVRVPADDR